MRGGGGDIKAAMMAQSEQYQQQFMKALGADSIEEAMMIAKAAGIQQQDIPQFMASQGMLPPGVAGPPRELTRRQQLGIDPIPPQENIFDPNLIADGSDMGMGSGIMSRMMPPGMTPEEFE